MEDMNLIKLDSVDGEKSIDDYKGKNVVLYVYPKDNTAGCSTEAVEFNSLKDQFRHHNTEIIGLSRDSIQSHKNFKEKYTLRFNLISDPQEELLEKLDVLKEVEGKDKKKIIRSTFIFDKKGQLVKEYRNVKVKGHADDVLSFIKSNL